MNIFLLLQLAINTITTKQFNNLYQIRNELYSIVYTNRFNEENNTHQRARLHIQTKVAAKFNFYHKIKFEATVFKNDLQFLKNEIYTRFIKMKKSISGCYKYITKNNHLDIECKLLFYNNKLMVFEAEIQKLVLLLNAFKVKDFYNFKKCPHLNLYDLQKTADGQFIPLFDLMFDNLIFWHNRKNDLYRFNIDYSNPFNPVNDSEKIPVLLRKEILKLQESEEENLLMDLKLKKATEKLKNQSK